MANYTEEQWDAIKIELIIQSTEYCMTKVEDEFYMKSQIDALKETMELFIMKYNRQARPGVLTK